MNAPVAVGAAGFLSRYDALRGLLPGDPDLRAAAAEAFRTAGLPGGTNQRRIEAWKYTSLRPVAESRFQTPADPIVDVDSLLAHAPDLSAPRIVFVDGRFRGDLSSTPAGFARFADQPDFGTLTWPDREPMVALNTMLAEDGAELRIEPGTDAGIVHLISIGTGTTAFHPRHTLRLGAGARLTLLETSLGEGSYLHNPVTEIHVGPGAHLAHVRLQDEAGGAFHLATLYADIAEGGTYDGFTLNLGARVTRTEIRVILSGPQATAHMNGAQLLGGTQHADFTSVVRHAEPNGTSRQTVKNVLAGRSRGVFQGRVEVARAAQKTDGYQMNQALLLSPDAEVDTKPELEIFADDVKCSHGATVGELDAEQLFYLRSRGIGDGEARAILIRAFLTEALEAVTDEAIRAILDAGVQRWWDRQAAGQGAA
ncbi:MAG: Fe-S cluster assembly protein SufD [Acetobacteraceae bacterium]